MLAGGAGTASGHGEKEQVVVHGHHGHHHHHGHDHHGHHHHHNHSIEKLNTIYVVAVVLNLLFVIVEALAGLFSHSLGLLSDAGHNLSDVFSLLLAMVAFKLASTAATKRFTYGYRKTSVLISLLNAIILLVAVGAIVVESVAKIGHPVEVNGTLITWTAAVGIVINGATALALSRQQKHDINTRGAYLHMLADTLVSLGVVVAGIVISLTGWYLIDPIIGLVIAGVILVSTTRLLTESFRMSIDAVPESVDPDEVVHKMEQVPDVLNVHHVHIWPISTTETALTAHIVISESSLLETVTNRLKELLDAEGIHHSTLELETNSSHCTEHECHCGKAHQARIC
ncbi:MAG: cation diffusion facilitator family transporter [Bacteroidales bacterium]|nr:cation diffusion facilitator family transporter [Bacteroidales bacterium]